LSQNWYIYNNFWISGSAYHRWRTYQFMFLLMNHFIVLNPMFIRLMWGLQSFKGNMQHCWCRVIVCRSKSKSGADEPGDLVFPVKKQNKGEWFELCTSERGVVASTLYCCKTEDMPAYAGSLTLESFSTPRMSSCSSRRVRASMCD
jgi:hypothetical protein